MANEASWHLKNAENELRQAVKDLPAHDAHNIEAAIQIIKGTQQKSASWEKKE